ncbi:MAG: hypothetical protein PHS59_15205 [Paludibacter sp.]|nr:hypothetical protein [Paludibacter sp.]
MKTNTIIKGTIFTITLLLSACSPTYYLPTKQNVILFEEKGDAFITGNLATDGLMGVEGGYSFSDNIGLYSSFNKFDISIYGNTNRFIKDFCWDNELVLYKRYKSGIYTGLNAGVGFGEFNVNNPYFDLGYNRQFIQPSFGMKIFNRIEHVDLAISYRLTSLNYNALFFQNRTDYDINMAKTYFNLTDILNGKSFYFFEPALTLGFTYDFFKIRFQYARAFKFGEEMYFYQRESISSSLSLDINKLFFNRMNKTKKLHWAF